MEPERPETETQKTLSRLFSLIKAPPSLFLRKKLILPP